MWSILMINSSHYENSHFKFIVHGKIAIWIVVTHACHHVIYCSSLMLYAKVETHEMCRASLFNFCLSVWTELSWMLRRYYVEKWLHDSGTSSHSQMNGMHSQLTELNSSINKKKFQSFQGIWFIFFNSIRELW